MEDLFRGLFDRSPDAMLVVDEAGLIVAANPTALAWSGYQADEVAGRLNILDVVPPTERMQATLLLLGAARGEPVSSTLGVVRKNGSAFRAEFTAIRVPSGDGARVVVTVRDVTRRDLDIQRLRAISALHRQGPEATTPRATIPAGLHILLAVGSHPVGLVYARDETGGGYSVVAAAAGSVALTAALSTASIRVDEADELLRERPPASEPLTRIPLPPEALAAAVEAGCERAVALPLVVAGEPVGLLVVGLPRGTESLEEDEGEWLRLVAQEITVALWEADQAEALARAVADADRARARLAAFCTRASHDLSEPVRGITTLAGFLPVEARAGQVETVVDLAERIRETGERVKGMILRLGEISKMDVAEPPLGGWRLVETVRAVADALAPLLEERRGRIVVETPMPDVRATRSRVLLALTILMENAILHNTSAPPVAFVSAAERPDGYVEVSVQDNGPGIEPERREDVFDVFRRSASTGRDEGPIGTGLTLAKTAIGEAGGRIWIGRSPRGGADVRFTLPRAGSGGSERV